MSRLLPMSPFWFLAAFVLLWCTVSAILAFGGGWFGLARRYRGRPAEMVRSITMASGSFDGLGAHYGNCLTVSVSPAGIGLSVVLPFRAFHPPVLIPWSAIEQCESWKWLGLFDRTRVRFAAPRRSFTFYGRAARFVRDAVHEADPQPAFGQGGLPQPS